MRPGLALVAFPLLVSGLSAAPIPATEFQETVFPYPAKAQLVICLNGCEKAKDRLNKMLANALPDESAKLARLMDSALNRLAEGRKSTALRKDARIFLVVNDLGGLVEGNGALSVLLPVTGYKEFRESLLTKEEARSFETGREGVDSFKSMFTGDETTIYTVAKKEYVVLTADKGVADSYAARYAQGSTEPMGKHLAESFLQADLAVYLNMDSINDQFGDRIRDLPNHLDFGIQQVQQQGGLPGFSRRQVDALKVGLKGLLQAVEDCRALVLTGEFRPEGLLVKLQARFRQDSISARFIQREASQPLKRVMKMPGGMNVYTETRFGGVLNSLMHQVGGEFSVPDDNVQAAAALQRDLKVLSEAGPQGTCCASKGANANIAVAHYKDPGQAIAAMVKTFEDLPAGAKMNSITLKNNPNVTLNAQKHRGFTFTEVRLQFDFEATVSGLPEAAKEAALEVLKRTATERATMWLGTDGNQVVTLTNNDWPNAKAVLDTYQDGKLVAANDKAFKATRDQLPADASMIVIGETSSSIDSVQELFRAMPRAVPNFQRMAKPEPLQLDPSYFGMAVSFKEDVFGLTAFIPTGSIRAGKKLFEGFFQNFD